MADDTIILNIDELTIDDCEKWEEITGEPIEVLESYAGGDKMPPMKFLKAIVFIVKHKDDPDFTIEDAGKVKFSQLGSPENPTKAGSSRKSSSRSSTSGGSRRKPSAS